MKLVEKVLEILNSVSDIKTVIYDSGFSTNVRIDREPVPAALLYLLDEFDVDISKGQKKESANMQVFIFNICPLDAKGEEKDEILDGIEPLVFEVIRRLSEDKDISIDSNIRIKSTYGRFDKFVIGYSVELKIESRQGECL